MSTEMVILVPPGGGGVRDYADILARRMPARVLAIAPETPLADYGEGHLLLNFSGYGYQPRGVPTWLVRRMRQLRPRVRKIGVFFHELYATQPPWRSAFWLSPLQRRIAAELVQLSDFWVTNCEQAAVWLRRHSAGTPHDVLPVFSNVGEPASLSVARRPKIVVFGGRANRASTYRHLGEDFWRWVGASGMQVHDIGPALADGSLAPLQRAGLLTQHGALPAHEVSRHLGEASHGLLRYPTEVVGKSGVFAAYCAHGLCPVLIAPDYAPHDGLQADRHYVAGLAALMRGEADPVAMGAAARQWYAPHRSQAHVDTLSTLLSEALVQELVQSCWAQPC